MTTAPVNTTAVSAGTECTGRLSETRVWRSCDGRGSPTAGPSGASRKAGLVAGAVGAVHSCVAAANHRGATGPHLVDVNCEAKDRRWLFLGTSYQRRTKSGRSNEHSTARPRKTGAGGRGACMATSAVGTCWPQRSRRWWATRVPQAWNRIVQGWGHYYHYGHCTRGFASQQHWLNERLRGQ